jgi:hypothetical protein
MEVSTIGIPPNWPIGFNGKNISEKFEKMKPNGKLGGILYVNKMTIHRGCAG